MKARVKSSSEPTYKNFFLLGSMVEIISVVDSSPSYPDARSPIVVASNRGKVIDHRYANRCKEGNAHARRQNTTKSYWFLIPVHVKKISREISVKVFSSCCGICTLNKYDALMRLHQT